MAAQALLVETDILVDFLTTQENEPSLLRLLLAELPCYTTYIQAAELYACAHNEEEQRRIEPALHGVRVLGASARYAATVGAIMRDTVAHAPLPVPSWRTLTTAAIAVESQLPIVTKNFLRNYEQIPRISIIEAGVVRQLILRGVLREHITTQNSTKLV